MAVFFARQKVHETHDGAKKMPASFETGMGVSGVNQKLYLAVSCRLRGSP